jgi:hypothetical protein
MILVLERTYGRGFVPSIQMYSALMAIVVSSRSAGRPGVVAYVIPGCAGRRQTYGGSRFKDVF